MATRPSILTRRRILKAASRIFAEHGFEGASIRDIVTKADVNQAAINYHFGSKEGLYRAVLEMALAALTNADAGSVATSARFCATHCARGRRSPTAPLVRVCSLTPSGS